jgi:hypothetical protein
VKFCQFAAKTGKNRPRPIRRQIWPNRDFGLAQAKSCAEIRIANRFICVFLSIENWFVCVVIFFFLWCVLWWGWLGCYFSSIHFLDDFVVWVFLGEGSSKSLSSVILWEISW